MKLNQISFSIFKAINVCVCLCKALYWLEVMIFNSYHMESIME